MKYLSIGVATLSLLISLFSWRCINTRQNTDAAVLYTISSLLQERDKEARALQMQPFAEPGAGVFGSYLSKIRRDGMSKNAEMKQRLNELAMNTAALLTLVDLYEPQAKTATFKSDAKKFRTYAIAWTDRWNSIMETFMAGGNYPSAEAPFPSGFAEAVKAELEAAR